MSAGIKRVINIERAVMLVSERVRKRFEAKVVKNKETGCWDWAGSASSHGYGQIYCKGKNWRAHRFSYMIYKGEIPEDKVLMHECDNKLCVNPSHLKAGTQADNIADMVAKGRQAKGKRHGMYGVRSFGATSPNYDSTSYMFENKKKRWKIKCTQHYLRTTFKLGAGNLSNVLAGKRKTVAGWSLS